MSELVKFDWHPQAMHFLACVCCCTRVQDSPLLRGLKRLLFQSHLEGHEDQNRDYPHVKPVVPNLALGHPVYPAFYLNHNCNRWTSTSFKFFIQCFHV